MCGNYITTLAVFNCQKMCNQYIWWFETVWAEFVLGIDDLPAKASVLCAKQYNGELGCSVYLYPGKQLENVYEYI